jgi:hypothetical protein
MTITPSRTALLRCVIIPVSYAIFFGGLMIAGLIFFRGRPFDLKAAIISDLESPDDNPHGYVPSAASTAVSGAMLASLPVVSFQRLKQRRWLAVLGAVLFALGLGAAIAIGILAPFTRGYTPVHIQLAYLAFVGICGGTLLHLIAARGSKFVIGFQCVALLFLIYLYFGPEMFDNKRLLSSLAFWEWVLCANCGAGLWMLAKAIE